MRKKLLLCTTAICLLMIAACGKNTTEQVVEPTVVQESATKEAATGELISEQVLEEEKITRPDFTLDVSKYEEKYTQEYPEFRVAIVDTIWADYTPENHINLYPALPIIHYNGDTFFCRTESIDEAPGYCGVNIATGEGAFFALKDMWLTNGNEIDMDRTEFNNKLDDYRNTQRELTGIHDCKYLSGIYPVDGVTAKEIVMVDENGNIPDFVLTAYGIQKVSICECYWVDEVGSYWKFEVFDTGLDGKRLGKALADKTFSTFNGMYLDLDTLDFYNCELNLTYRATLSNGIDVYSYCDFDSTIDLYVEEITDSIYTDEWASEDDLEDEFEDDVDDTIVNTEEEEIPKEVLMEREWIQDTLALDPGIYKGKGLFDGYTVILYQDDLIMLVTDDYLDVFAGGSYWLSTMEEDVIIDGVIYPYVYSIGSDYGSQEAFMYIDEEKNIVNASFYRKSGN